MKGNLLTQNNYNTVNKAFVTIILTRQIPHNLKQSKIIIKSNLKYLLVMPRRPN